MRMRQLGRGHSLAFWASHEAHTAIAALAAAATSAADSSSSSSSSSSAVTSAEVLAWTLANTAAAVPESMLQWASHGLGHARRAAAAAAHRTAMAAATTRLAKGATAAANTAGTATAASATACRQLAAAWQDTEVTALAEFYRQPRQRTAVPVIAQLQLQQARERTASTTATAATAAAAAAAAAATATAATAAVAAVAAAGAAIVQRTERYAGHISRFAAPCDEEQERELEQEQEEEQEVERPPSTLAHVPRLDPAILALAQGVLPRRSSAALQPLSAAFSRTQLQGLSQQCGGWHLRTSVTREFLKVVQPASASEGLDSFLRPPCWLVVVPPSSSSGRDNSSSSSTVVLVSPYEANALMPAFRQGGSGTASGVSLHMYAPRMRPQQSTLLLRPALALPLDSSSSSVSSSSVSVTAQQQAQLAAFSGSLFFATAVEQHAYGTFLGLCPRPRTKAQEAAFSSGSVERSGFVLPAERAAVASQLVAVCKFKQCPVALVEKILQLRAHLPPLSHVTSVLSRGQLAHIQQPAEGAALVQ
jgi:hypothetical protein